MGKIMIASAFTLALLGALSIGAAAQTSCSGWNKTCQSRCVARGAGADCPYCKSQMTSCRTSGCWTEGAAQGGGKHCNLKKS